MPDGTVYVGRPGVFGNPYVVGIHETPMGKELITGVGAVAMFRAFITNSDDPRAKRMRARLPELRGRDLACFCPPEHACHADVLLELANMRRLSPAMRAHLEWCFRVSGMPGCRFSRGAVFENQLTHDALVWRGLLAEDAEGFTIVTKLGEDLVRAGRKGVAA